MTTNNMQMALNSALEHAKTAWSRFAAARFGVGQPLDNKRSGAWCEYGWPAEVTNQMLYELYRRTGVAHGAVDKLNGLCWQTPPEMVEGGEEKESKNETPWEKATSNILTDSVWQVFKDADRRRLVNRFSGIILQIADNQKWDQPVRGTPVVRKIIAAWATDLKPVEFDTDEKSENYGSPKMWEYTERKLEGTSSRSVRIHPDRIFILGDWDTGSIGFLEPAYNAFVSLEKVEGGSGESFLKNASRQVSVNFDKEVNLAGLASTYGVSVTELQEKFNDAARELNRGNDQMLITQGASVSTLTATVADPKATYDVNLQTVSAALDIPTKILVGMQTGERASTEDQKYFNARGQSRRKDLSFEIVAFVQHLQRIKIIGAMAEFHVMWDELNEQTEGEKLDNSKKMADINASSLALGEMVFDANELRAAAGYEPAKGDRALPDQEPEDPEDPNGNPTDPTGTRPAQ